MVIPWHRGALVSRAGLQVPVDRTGPTVTNPGTTRTTVPVGSFDAGPVSMNVDTSTDRFVRAEILDSTGLLVAGSNPVWLLRATPPGGIPPSRGV